MLCGSHSCEHNKLTWKRGCHFLMQRGRLFVFLRLMWSLSSWRSDSPRIGGFRSLGTDILLASTTVQRFNRGLAHAPSHPRLGKLGPQEHQPLSAQVGRLFPRMPPGDVQARLPPEVSWSAAGDSLVSTRSTHPYPPQAPSTIRSSLPIQHLPAPRREQRNTGCALSLPPVRSSRGNLEGYTHLVGQLSISVVVERRVYWRCRAVLRNLRWGQAWVSGSVLVLSST